MTGFPFVRSRFWPLMFPLTYLVHIAEEYWVGGGFYDWIARTAGSSLTAERFLMLNALAWIVMFAVCLAATISNGLKWSAIALGAVVLLNGAAHVIGSLLTLTYSPGVLSGIFLWIPLGSVTLYDVYHRTRTVYFVVAAGVGLALHAVVTFLAIAG